MEVRLAKTAGFCYGVKRAVELVYKAVDDAAESGAGKRDIYTYGPIVHNETVVDELKMRGVGVIEDREMLMDLLSSGKLADAVIIIRAHGAPTEIFESIKRFAPKAEIIDATCPHVKRIHDIVTERHAMGDRIAICGDPDHPEVKGILGQINGDAEVFNDTDSAAAFELPEGERLTFVSQTTQSTAKFQDIVDILNKKSYYTNVIDTICNATQRRQSEAADLASKCDAMLVIGGRNSSNTRKLYDICLSECKRTYLIQSITDIKGTIDHSVRCVGITAGASTPRTIIEEVFKYVRDEF